MHLLDDLLKDPSVPDGDVAAAYTTSADGGWRKMLTGVLEEYHQRYTVISTKLARA